MWFGSRPEESLHKGTGYGYAKLTGLERLQITFALALPANHVCDVIGFQLAILTNDAVGSVKKTVVA